MDFRILGPLEVHTENGPLRLGGAKQRAVLAVLLLNANQVVSSDRLIDLLWGDGHPPTAATALQGHISALRKVLQPRRGPGHPDGTLLTRPPGYLISLDPEQLDLARFERLRAQGAEALASGEHAAAREKLVEALSLWRGAPLADLGYEAFAQAEISRLEELRLAAVEDRVQADLSLGRHADVVGELESLIAEHPLRERLRAQLMLAFYRSGRQAEALEVYRDTRRALVEELGIEPTRELQELERAVLAQDASLDLPARPVPAARTATVGEEPPATAAAAPAVSSFVGRRDELAEVEAGLDASLDGETALFLVAGEPGIGKSRFADEVAVLATSRGARVLWGRCWEAGGAPAYWPWVQALRTYIRQTPPGELRAQLGRGAGDMAQMLPELRDLFGDLPEPPSLDPEGARFRLFDSTTVFLHVAGAAAPLVLVLDDMHAADPSSLLLLRFLARELRGARVVFLAAYRDSEATSNRPLREALVELRREPITRLVALGGLAPPEVARFVESIAGAPPSPEVAAAIHGETEGNPLFVGELVRLLVSEGRLEDVGDEDWLASVPRGLRDVIGQRLRLLSADCKRLLSVASVLGRDFGLDVLEPVSGCTAEEVLDLLDEALDARVVGEVPGRRSGLRFSHALIRDSLYGELPTSERLRLHRHTAEALEALHEHDPEPHLAELAYHFLESAPAGGVDKAIDYARRAGERAAALLAYEESARLYAMALEALSLRRVADEPARCELLLALGDAQARGADLATAKETFVRAAEVARSLQAPEQLARAALGYGGRFVWFRAGDDPRLIPLLEDALAAQASGGGILRARLLTRLAGALRDHPVPERRSDLSREAVEMAEALGDRATLSRALEGIYAASRWPLDLEEWLETLSRMIRLAEEAGDLEQAFAGHVHAVSSHLARSDMHALDRELEAASSLAEQLRQPVQRWAAMMPRGMLANTAGDVEEADRLLRAQVELGRTSQGMDMTFHFVVTLQTWAVRRHQGRLSEVEETVEGVVARYPLTSILRSVLASLYAELGRRGKAAEQLDRLAADDFAALHLGSEFLFSASLIAEVCAFLGDEPRSAFLYEALLPYERYNVISHPEVCLGAAPRYLGILATTLRRWEDAARHFESALERNAAIGARPWVARTQDDYARMLLARDAPGDRERARELVDAAVATFRELGMNGWAERSAAVPAA